MILPESLPSIKVFCQSVTSLTSVVVLSRLIAGFIEHVGRMSASEAAGSIRTAACHRANVVRYLARLGLSRDWRVLELLAEQLLQMESRRSGHWIFIVDQTYNGQSGSKTENTFSRANYRPRQKQSSRKQKKWARRSCQAFVMGLLITPSGYRIPSCRCYYTKDYSQAKGMVYRTQTEWAAELIRQAPIPAAARVYVLGDTAFDAECIRAACAERKWSWIVPVNPERVLAGRKSRRRVRSLVSNLQAKDFEAYELQPGRGEGRAHRRLSRFRVGRKAKTRTYYVHGEPHDVHSVGKALLVFSTKEAPKAGKAVHVQKILMTNDTRLRAADVVDLYDLRWQIELFFKELKSTLGFARYRFRQFAKVEGWTQVCLIAFVYLEWRRARALRRRKLTDAERRFWESQRTYGGCQAVRQYAEEHDLAKLNDWLRTPTGRRKLRRALRQARPPEYRASA
jgi:Transposase DDE domain